MIKRTETKFANEFYRCIQNGWQMVTYVDDTMPRLRKQFSSGVVQTLRADGYRLLEKDGIRIIRRPDGQIVAKAPLTATDLLWTKNKITGKYEWKGEHPDMLNLPRQGYEFVPESRGVAVPYCQKKLPNGMTEVILATGRKSYILPDGQRIVKVNDGEYQKTRSWGRRNLGWGKDERTGKYLWKNI